MRKLGKQRRQQSKQQLPYERFTHYLSIMHRKALELLDGLNDEDQRIVENFFVNTYKQEKEHYWSITKLFYHAMYIPIFLQIAKKHFREQVYIDTHSGPGLAKIGADKRDIVLGSPLLALHWPRIVAERVKQFRKIIDGFTRLYFVDIDYKNTGIIKRFTAEANNVEIKTGDANHLLPRIDVPDEALVYLFVDPYGSFDSQLGFRALASFVIGKRVDVMINILAPNIAQGLSSIRDEDQLLRRIEWLFGEGFCESKLCEKIGIRDSLCCPGPKSVNHILRAYWCVFARLGYSRAVIMPVKFRGSILYYMMLAVRGSGEWIRGYRDYIHLHAPKDYETLRALWLETTGRQRSLLSFLRR